MRRVDVKLSSGALSQLSLTPIKIYVKLSANRVIYVVKFISDKLSAMFAHFNSVNWYVYHTHKKYSKYKAVQYMFSVMQLTSYKKND